MSFFMEVWNRFNKAILPSPLHGITSKNTLLVTYQGSRSGKEYTVPVNYTQEGNTVRITSFPQRKWWRSLRTNPEVQLTIRGKVKMGSAQVYDDAENTAKELKAYLLPKKNMAKYFQVGVSPDGSLNQQDLHQAAKNRLVIKIELDE